MDPVEHTHATSGVLVLAATPIGSLSDAPPRLADELARADVVAAEDTRRLRRLVAGLRVEPRGRVLSYFEGNEARRTIELTSALERGERVLLVTDAGTPSISDPGYRLVTAALAVQATVTAVPGPSAVLTALAVSGLPVDRFCFEGFPPRRTRDRTARLRELVHETRTLVFFESPQRLPTTLRAMVDVFGGDRPAAVCRELTKLYEEVRRGGLDELVAWAEEGVRGEITIVVGGAPPTAPEPVDDAELARRVFALVEAGFTRKEAMSEVATQARVRRSTVYDAIVASKPRPFE